mmetsp:Transcript_43998/g.110899  ORF Transcript_43998/g.110899 Transcript_43998/m.110899 type:complete len:332 (-) Transcript_43998:84-1079(-)
MAVELVDFLLVEDQVGGGLAILVCEENVCVAVDERLDCLAVLLVLQRGVQRRVAVGVHHVGGHALRDEELDGLLAVVVCGVVERRVAVLVLGVQVSPVLLQQLQARHAVHCGAVHRGGSVLGVGGVLVGLMVQQQLQERGLVQHARNVCCVLALAILPLNVVGPLHQNRKWLLLALLLQHLQGVAELVHRIRHLIPRSKEEQLHMELPVNFLFLPLARSQRKPLVPGNPVVQLLELNSSLAKKLIPFESVVVPQAESNLFITLALRQLNKGGLLLPLGVSGLDNNLCLLDLFRVKVHVDVRVRNASTVFAEKTARLHDMEVQVALPALDGA